MRKTPLITNSIYHICNRGVNKGDIFFEDQDYRRFLKAALHYKTKISKFSYEGFSKDNLPASNDPGSLESKVQILAYCLMPNHFHFLLKQLADGGVTSYMQHLINSYVHYVNTKYKRVGPLLQGRFRNVLIESDEQLMHVSRYIHLNPLVSNLTSDLKKYAWSSYPSFVGIGKDELCDGDLVTNYYKTREDYEKFVLDQEDYARELERIKHFILD